MADLANRRSSESFRRLVAFALSAHGLDAQATPLPGPVKLSDALASDEPYRVAPDVDGLGPRWHVATLASIRQEGFSAALDAAERDARFSGATFPVLAAYRRGRDAPEAYAIMTLDTLARIVAELERVHA
jgi:hypothetical protein